MTGDQQAAAVSRSYRRGDWFGVLGSGATVLLPPSEKARVPELWRLADEGAGFDLLLDALVAGGLSGLPGFVLVGHDGPTRVVVRGAAKARLVLADGSTEELDGTTAATWVERTVDRVESLTLEVAEPVDATDLPIEDGLVRVARVDQPPYAAGASVPPQPVREPEPVAVAAPSPTDLSTGLSTDLPTEAMPVVPAPPAFSPPPPPPPAPVAPPAAPVADDHDHDGHTQAGGWDPNRFARQHPGIPGQPPAPSVTAQPVARLLFSSGETVDVDRAVLIGRAPEARRFTSTDQPRLVTVPSPHQEISSTHLEVRPGSGADHGSAVVTDMGSTNGTVLQQPGLPPEDLQPGIPVQLLPGSVIDLGDGVSIQVTQP